MVGRGTDTESVPLGSLIGEVGRLEYPLFAIFLAAFFLQPLTTMAQDGEQTPGEQTPGEELQSRTAVDETLAAAEVD